MDTPALFYAPDQFMTYLSIPLAFILSVFSTAANSGCFDSPTWDGNPMSRAFIDGEVSKSTSAGRVALLEYLLRTESVARIRRDDVAHTLIPTALIAYEGDRTPLRRKMKAGDLREMISLLALDTPEPDGRDYQVVMLYWLNGCVDEAFDTLSRLPWPPRTLSILPLATGETELGRKLVTASRDGEPNMFHVALLDLAEYPGSADRITRDFIAFLDDAVGADVTREDQLPRFGAETLLAVIEKREAPPPPETWREYKYASLAALFAAVEACAPVADLISQLEQVPPGREDSWRTLIDIAAVRCAMQ